MNIFAIPSWYPSELNPIYGTFIKDQIFEIAKHHPDVNQGVSIWGQGDDNHLLWTKDHLKNVRKIVEHKGLKEEKNKVSNNLIEFKKPALTWTRKLFSGNRQGILAANQFNFEAMQAHFGDVNLIQAHASFPAGLIAQHLSEKWGIPYIITTHMSPFPFQEFLKPNGELRAMINEPLRKATSIIAVSQSMNRRLRAFNLSPIVTIPNCIDPDAFQMSKPVEGKTFRFVVVARLVPQKGLDILLQAISQLGRQHYQVHIIGSGPDQQKLKDMIKRFNLQDVVYMLGEKNRTETAAEIMKSHALILPSRHESFGVVLIEAMACGKPIIATTCGGPTDILNETNGLTVTPEDPEDLAAKIDLMMKQYDRYDPKVIRTDFESRFASPAVTPQIVNLYQQLIEAHPRA